MELKSGKDSGGFIVCSEQEELVGKKTWQAVMFMVGDSC